MENSQALRTLRLGCHEIGLEPAAAKELLRLLELKKYVGEEGSQRLGQSGKLDALLHWLLLNTTARKAIEAVVGEIWHSTAASDTEETKAEKRLASLNAMSRDGWTPRLELWEEPGTALDAIYSISLTHKHSGDQFCMFYTVQFGHVAIEERIDNPGCIADKADEKHFRSHVAKALKRGQVSGGRQDATQPAGAVDVYVQTNFGKRFVVRLRLTATFERLKEIINDIQGVPTDQQRLIFAGKQMYDEYTLAEANVQAESTVHMVLRLRGC